MKNLLNDLVERVAQSGTWQDDERDADLPSGHPERLARAVARAVAGDAVECIVEVLDDVVIPGQRLVIAGVRDGLRARYGLPEEGGGKEDHTPECWKAMAMDKERCTCTATPETEEVSDGE
jgi:hypothetical protein